MLYVCNGTKKGCMLSKECYKNGGECRTTSDIRFAKGDIRNKAASDLQKFNRWCY